MKKFITIIPRQAVNDLASAEYVAADNKKLEYGETRFPVIPMINGYAAKGESVELIAVCEDYDNSQKNLQFLKEEINTLDENGFAIDLIVIGGDGDKVDYDDNISKQLAVFQKLISKLNDNDELFACITYGSKPMPIVEMMALRFALRARKNMIIRCVVYGQIDFTKKKAGESEFAWIYDLTPLVQMDDIVRLLAEAGVKDVESAIKDIIDL